MSTPHYERFLELVTKHNLGTETIAEHTELDNDWLYGPTETYRVMFEIISNRDYINPLQVLLDSIRQLPLPARP